ncbi:MAG: TIGR00282 family metallophosphoesterase [Brevinemataceae bacterium]
MKQIPLKNPKHLRIAVFGDITGVAGRETAKEIFPLARTQWNTDIIIANAENASHGFGLTPKHALELQKYGADILTMGNHIWDKHLLRYRINTMPFIVRPLNMIKETPGSGYYLMDTKFGKLAVINLLGRIFMNPSECPFHSVFDTIKKLQYEHNIKMIAVDFHAEATSEKLIMGRFLDGKASLVWGTHTHVPTADEKILPKGTGYVTDIGMTGAEESILGFELAPTIKKMVYNEPYRFKPEVQGSRISTGIIADIDPENGQTIFLTRFKQTFEHLDNLLEDLSKSKDEEENTDE